MTETNSRNWCFTLPNYTSEEVATLSSLDKQIRYIIFGKEICPTTSTPHLQGYVIFHNQKKFNQVKKYFGDRFHIEESKGNSDQNIAYCSKDKDYIELGEPPKNKGKRTDIEDVKALVKSGANMRQIADACSSFQSLKFAESLMKYQPHPPAMKRTIKWYHGPTGTGKTRIAVEEAGDDYYITMKDLKWWDGYFGQKVVIIDDFRKDFCTFHEMLRILDRYPYRVQSKGTSFYLSPSTDTIIITSAYHPSEVYNTREDIEQLIRRIDEIKIFT